jgi:multidrug resistance protein MdtO
VSVGSENISYAGVQVGLAFLLTILNGFAPSTSMDAGRDRIIGILLGNVVVYLFFTGIWPKSAAEAVSERLRTALAALARIAALAPAAREAATTDAEIVETEAAAAGEQIELLPFEPADQRPDAARIETFAALAAEARALVPLLMFSDAPTPAASERLARVAERVGRSEADPAAVPPGESVAAGDVLSRIGRIERLATGGAA